MKQQEKAALVQLYEDRYVEMGHDVRTLGWNDRADQELRFRVLCDVADLSHKHVCDIGCGFGDLYPYLCARYGGVSYTGIDLSPSLVQKAQELHPGIQFRRQDILEEPPERYDYFLLSGALNYRLADNMKFTRDMLSVMFDRATAGLAVNFLTSYVTYQRPHNFHHSPEAVFALARGMTPWTTIRHDYPLWEFTLFMYKNPYGARR